MIAALACTVALLLVSALANAVLFVALVKAQTKLDEERINADRWASASTHNFRVGKHAQDRLEGMRPPLTVFMQPPRPEG